MRTFPDFPSFVLSSLGSVLIDHRTVNCVWELTYRCNAKCDFCAYWRTPADAGEELTLTDIYQAIDKVHRSGCRLINFSGGEPTLRDDLEEIVRYASRLRIWTSLTTNGSRLDPDRIKRLRAAGLDNLFISLDFVDRDSHDRHRRIPGLYDKIMNSLAILKNDFLGGHRTAGLMCVVSNRNIASAEALTEIARRNGVLITFQLYHPKKVDVEPFRIHDSHNIAEALLALKRSHGNVISSTHYLRGMDRYHARPCAAGRKYFSIDPMGYLHPCVDLPAVGHVLRDPVSITRSPSATQFVQDCSGCWYCFRGEADHALSIRGRFEKIGQFAGIVWRGR